MNRKKRIGLIVPPADGAVPPEADALYGGDVEFVAYGLGIEKMVESSFLEALKQLEDAAKALVEQGSDAISVMGTSLTFFQGRKGNEEIHRRLSRSAPGVPVTTLSSSIIRTIQRKGAKKIAVFTAYDRSMSQRLLKFLGEHDLSVTRCDNLDLLDISDVHNVSQVELQTRIAESLGIAREEADALLISCGGLRTLDLLEKWNDFPVISSAVDGIEEVVALAQDH